MALSANVIWQKTGGSDSAGGGFDPSLTTNMFTDLVIVSAGNTASPVVSSASYNFASGDVGSWLFIATTTNGWYAGWYKIASVSSGQATLAANVTSYTVNGVTTYVGQAQSYAAAPTGGGYQTYALNGQFYTNTTVGCSSNATQSTNKAVWAIDRSRNTSIWTGGTTATSSSTAFTIVADSPSYTTGKQDVGNIIQAVSGTNGTGTFTAGCYAISNATSTILTLDRSVATSSGTATAITWNLGGSFATIGGFGLQLAVTNVGLASNVQRLYCSGSETLGSATANIATGCFSTANALAFEGFNSTCGDLGPGAYLSAGSQTPTAMATFTTATNNVISITNIVLDGNTGASVGGVVNSSGDFTATGCLLVNFNGTGTPAALKASSSGPPIAIDCYIYNTYYPFNGCVTFGCVSDSCTVGFYPPSGLNNSQGGTRDVSFLCTTGFQAQSRGTSFVQGIAYKCTGQGFNLGATVSIQTCIDCCSYGNGTTAGYNFDTGSGDNLINCAGGAASSGNLNGVTNVKLVNFFTLTSDPYAGNHIGGATDLVVNGTNNTWVTTATNTTAGGGGSTQSAADIGLSLWIYGGTGWTPGRYLIIGYDSGTGSWILNFSPAAASTTGGKWRIADFRPNNVAGGGAALRAAGIGAAGQVDAIDIGAVQHAAGASGGLLLPMNMNGGLK